MRINQIEVLIEGFAEQSPEASDRPFHLFRVYADSQNCYEALAAAFNESMLEVHRHDGEENIPNGWTPIASYKVMIHFDLASFDPSPSYPVVWADWLRGHSFTASAANIHEALCNAFNSVLCHIQKHRALPIDGDKKHTDPFR